MINVLDIAKSPEIQKIFVPEYDFKSQTHSIRMGKFTMNSQQTFDWSGKPQDAQSDSNDY